jgi:hypothetical protein
VRAVSTSAASGQNSASYNMNRLFLLLLLSLLVGGCATENIEANLRPESVSTHIAPFSINATGGLPEDWHSLVLFRTKKRTEYQLVSEKDRIVLHARAAEASSGLMQYVNIDPFPEPLLHWEWKVGSMMETREKTQYQTEDSPARIILGFDGDKDSLPFSDQILFETAKLFTGYDFPYATLMYIWDKDAPIGSVMASRHSARIKMLVVANSAEGVGKWQVFTRNIAEDYEKAFDEKPGHLIGVGVLTDTDNLGETVEAWYGDITLAPTHN